MASIFRRSKKKNSPYTIQYTDHEGERRTAKGFTDKGLTKQLAAKLESEARLRQMGLIDPVQEQFAQKLRSDIEPHLIAFEDSLTDNSPKHVKLTMTRIRRIVAGCQIQKLADINAEAVLACLRCLRKSGGIGHRTYNHYLQAADSFCNWCVASKQGHRFFEVGLVGAGPKGIPGTAIARFFRGFASTLQPRPPTLFFSILNLALALGVETVDRQSARRAGTPQQ